MMQPQPPNEPLQDAYLALASLDRRIKELHILIDAMSAHMIGYQALYSSADAYKWVEDMFKLIEKAEKLQKEDSIDKISNH